MSKSGEHDLNQAAYRNLKQFIRQNYPHGRFVAIAGGKIVADAATFREIDQMLDQMGFTSPDVLVAEAGVEYGDMDILHCMAVAES
jgi:hypothetical protein